jgi:hypothetical protein
MSIETWFADPVSAGRLHWKRTAPLLGYDSWELSETTEMLKVEGAEGYPREIADANAYPFKGYAFESEEKKEALLWHVSPVHACEKNVETRDEQQVLELTRIKYDLPTWISNAWLLIVKEVGSKDEREVKIVNAASESPIQNLYSSSVEFDCFPGENFPGS